jgi:hypothetical protein
MQSVGKNNTSSLSASTRSRQQSPPRMLLRVFAYEGFRHVMSVLGIPERCCFARSCPRHIPSCHPVTGRRRPVVKASLTQRCASERAYSESSWLISWAEFSLSSSVQEYCSLLHYYCHTSFSDILLCSFVVVTVISGITEVSTCTLKV